MQLYLLRHAKSSWDNPHQGDFDRPLNSRGKKAAPFMGQVMKERNICPDKILCSPAKRTRETLSLLLEASQLDCPVDYVDGIYEASVGELRKILRKQKDGPGSILMIGHNPGMEGLFNDLTGDWERFPTACLASISLNIKSWQDIEPRSGKQEWVLTPKGLKADSHS